MNQLYVRVWSALAAALLLPAAAGTTLGDQWPQWRGPNHDGVSQEKEIPSKWSKTENVLWRLPLPGPAGATPVIWGDHIFLTSAKDKDLVLICANTFGKQLWEVKLGEGDAPVRGDEGNSASPSPATDGKHVWAMLGTGALGCYTFTGKEVWKLDLQEKYGKFSIAFGMTSTPVLDNGRLYIQLFHTNYYLLVALDGLTGKEIWKHERQSDARAECEHSYASPTLYREGKTAYLIAHGCDYVSAHSLDDGREIFRCGGLNAPGAKYNPTLRFVASPVAAEGLIVVPSAKNGPVLGLRTDAMGDITNVDSGHLWRRNDNTPDVPSPLVHDGLVYLCRENGAILCLDASNGAEIYLERGHSQRHRASPVYADGKIYLTARDGVVTVIKAGRKFEILESNEIGEDVSASPAISNGRIYLRSYEALYCIGSR
jgi:outer membrane protein assembly factor BamB